MELLGSVAQAYLKGCGARLSSFCRILSGILATLRVEVFSITHVLQQVQPVRLRCTAFQGCQPCKLTGGLRQPGCCRTCGAGSAHRRCPQPVHGRHHCSPLLQRAGQMRSELSPWFPVHQGKRLLGWQLDRHAVIPISRQAGVLRLCTHCPLVHLCRGWERLKTHAGPGALPEVPASACTCLSKTDDSIHNQCIAMT